MNPDKEDLLQAEMLRNAGEHQQALAIYRSLAERGSAEAQLEIGRMYEQGHGVEQNDVEAALWLEKAALQGSVVAQYELGILHVAADSAVLDFARGHVWFRKAADQGHADAQFNVGVGYENGYGVQTDQAEATNWFRRAAEHDHGAAEFKLAVIYLDGVGVPKNQQTALGWFRKAAGHGNASAQRNMGMFYIEGFGVAPDLAQAEIWLTRAAQQNEDTAKKLLAQLPALKAKEAERLRRAKLASLPVSDSTVAHLRTATQALMAVSLRMIASQPTRVAITKRYPLVVQLAGTAASNRSEGLEYGGQLVVFHGTFLAAYQGSFASTPDVARARTQSKPSRVGVPILQQPLNITSGGLAFSGTIEFSGVSVRCSTGSISTGDQPINVTVADGTVCELGDESFVRVGGKWRRAP